jgi:hypothetical protein
MSKACFTKIDQPRQYEWGPNWKLGLYLSGSERGIGGGQEYGNGAT